MQTIIDILNLKITKKCIVCENEKPILDFYFKNGGKYYRDSRCKKCANLLSKQYYVKNINMRREQNRIRMSRYTPEEYRKKQREWRNNNVETYNETKRKWKTKNIEKLRELGKKRRANIVERCKNDEQFNIFYHKRLEQYNKKWREKNYEKAKEIQRRSENKQNNTLKGKLNHSVSARIQKSLRRGRTKKNRHWETLVNFTIDQLKEHLEKLFKPGMTWENYGTYWQIDHKVPIAYFNYDKPEDINFKICWSLKNLQPLEAIENYKKHDKVDEEILNEVIAS